jgi:hypothetical protein
MNGRSGRLYRSLVLDQKVATGAGAGHNTLKWEGYFSISGTARPGQSPERVEEALYAELERLQTTPVPERELQKVKNRFAADSFRRIQSNFALMIQLLLAENNRGWQTFNDDPKKIAAVSAEDIQRVAKEYSKAERRAVITYITKAGDAPESTDPVLEGLSDEDQAQLRQARAMVAQMPVEQARQVLQKLEAEAASVPPEKRKFMEAMRQMLQERISKGGQL